MFVTHAPEEDELKSHKHVYFVPAKKINTATIIDFFIEKNPQDAEKPFKCMPCRSSKFDDAYLYFRHDKAYLASKGMSRKFEYAHSDIWCTDYDFLRELVSTVDKSKFIGMERLNLAVQNNMSFTEFFAMGGVPIQLISQYEKAYNLLLGAHTYRNGRQTHTSNVDEETGELLED